MMGITMVCSNAVRNILLVENTDTIIKQQLRYPATDDPGTSINQKTTNKPISFQQSINRQQCCVYSDLEQ
jgi:hypothetical protein